MPRFSEVPDDDGDPFIRNHPKPNGGTLQALCSQSLDQLVINTAPNYLIKGLLPRVGLGVIWGWYKSGKSFSALDMALCIAHARDYHGRKTKSGPVIYIALEGGSRYPDRIKAWHMINNMPQRGAPFYLLSDVQFDLFVDSAALIATIQEQVATAPAAIFVDTLNRAIAGSENGPEDMARFVRGCDALRIAFGCFVGVIHHSGAGGNDRPRGHTSLAGADDVGIAIGRDAAGLVTLHVDHIRDDAPAADLTFGLETIQVETNDEGDPIISAAVVTVAGGRPAPKLSGYDKIAYDLLAALIAENDGSNRDIGAGEKRPSCPASLSRGSFYKKHPGQDRDTKNAPSIAPSPSCKNLQSLNFTTTPFGCGTSGTCRDILYMSRPTQGPRAYRDTGHTPLGVSRCPARRQGRLAKVIQTHLQTGFRPLQTPTLRAGTKGRSARERATACRPRP